MDIILGRAGLTLHSPEVRWELCAITRWSEFWQQNCLTTVPKPRSSPIPAQLSSTLVESPEPAQVHTIPSDYAAFQDVFSKQALLKLEKCEFHRSTVQFFGYVSGQDGI